MRGIYNILCINALHNIKLRNITLLEITKNWEILRVLLQKGPTLGKLRKNMTEIT